MKFRVFSYLQEHDLEFCHVRASLFAFDKYMHIIYTDQFILYLKNNSLTAIIFHIFQSIQYCSDAN